MTREILNERDWNNLGCMFCGKQQIFKPRWDLMGSTYYAFAALHATLIAFVPFIHNTINWAIWGFCFGYKLTEDLKKVFRGEMKHKYVCECGADHRTEFTYAHTSIHNYMGDYTLFYFITHEGSKLLLRKGEERTITTIDDNGALVSMKLGIVRNEQHELQGDIVVKSGGFWMPRDFDWKSEIKNCKGVKYLNF